LQAAKHNKTKVLEAHLSVVAGTERIELVNQAEKASGRTALMFASYYSNLTSVELLAASDARFQLIDNKGRCCLHYAAINDNQKLIETIFLMSKTSDGSVAQPKSFEMNPPTQEVEAG
jgi:ankyrin repeat protein